MLHFNFIHIVVLVGGIALYKRIIVSLFIFLLWTFRMFPGWGYYE